MIAREWRCRCPREYRNGFIDHLQRTGVQDTRSTNGFKGAQIFERNLGEMIEIVLITYWDSLEHIKLYAGEDLDTARLYPGDEEFHIEPDSVIRHYNVTTNTFR